MPAGEFLIPELTGKEGTTKFSKDLGNMLSLSSAPEVAIQQNLTLPKKGVKRSAGSMTPEEHVVGPQAKILKSLKCYLKGIKNKERIQQIEKGLDALKQQIKSSQDQVELLKKEKTALLKEKSRDKRREQQKKRDLCKQVSPSVPKSVSSANARESTEIKSVKCVSAVPWSCRLKQEQSLVTNKDKLMIVLNKKSKLQNSNIKTNKIDSERIPHLKKKPKQPDSEVTKPEKRLPSARPGDGSSSASSTYSSSSGRGSSHHSVPERKSNKAMLCNASTDVNKIKTVLPKKSFPAKQKMQPLPGCSSRAQPVSASNGTSVQKKRPAKMLADRHVPPPKGFPPTLPLLPSGTGLPSNVAEPRGRSQPDKHEQRPKLSHAQQRNPGMTDNFSSLLNASGQHFSNQRKQECRSTPDVKANAANSKVLVRNPGSWAELAKMAPIAPVIPSSHELFQKFQKDAMKKKEQEKKSSGLHKTRDSHQSGVTQQLTKAKPEPGKLPLAPASAPPRHAPKTFSQPTVGPKVSAPPAPLHKPRGHDRELDRKREQERRREQPMSPIYYANAQKEIMEIFEKTHFTHFIDLWYSKEGSEQSVDLISSSSSSVGSIF